MRGKFRIGSKCCPALHGTGLPAVAVCCAVVALLLGARPLAAQQEVIWRALLIDGHGVHWPQALSPDFTLTYAIARGEHRDETAINCRAMGPFSRLAAKSGLDHERIREAAAEAFGRWQTVSRLNFREVDDDTVADIVIGEQLEPVGHAFTNLELASDLGQDARAIRHAAICLNPERRWKIGFDGNLTTYDLVHTLTHEIGHAIGLDHPGARGHVMSFRYDESIAGLTDGDIRGAVALYGARERRKPAD